MSENKTNSTPLWRELNEKRTQGIFIVDGDMIICTDNPETYPKAYNDGIVIFENATAENTTDESIVAHFAQQPANKKYTALAVNNLARLAEALEGLLFKIDTKYEERPTSTGANVMHKLKCDVEYQKAKEALAAIS